MDASVQDYIWNDPILSPVDTSAWGPEDWYKQIHEFRQRNQSAMKTWRGFREIREVIANDIRQSYKQWKHAHVDFTKAVSGTNLLPIKAHFRCVDVLSYSFSSERRRTASCLLVSRDGLFARLEYAAERLGTGIVSRVLVERYHLYCVGLSDVVGFLAQNPRRGALIMGEFQDIMRETILALTDALNEQKEALRTYEMVLARMKF